MNDEQEIKRLAKLINENIDDYSDEYEGLDDEDEFEDKNYNELIDRLKKIKYNNEYIQSIIDGTTGLFGCITLLL